MFHPNHSANAVCWSPQGFNKSENLIEQNSLDIQMKS